MNASLPKKAYVPGEIIILTTTRNLFFQGENIKIKCTVYNNSSVETKPRATLYQTRVFKCGERHKASQVPLSDTVIGDRIDSQSNSEQTLDIVLPEEASLSIKSDAIVVKYFIHVTLDIPHAFDIHVNLPFVVTTYPAIDWQN